MYHWKDVSRRYIHLVMLRSLELNNRAHSLSEVESYEELVEREIERRLERGGSTRGGRVHEGWVYGGRGGGDGGDGDGGGGGLG